MGLFSRKVDRVDEARDTNAGAGSQGGGDGADEDALVVPTVRAIPPEERERIDRALAELETGGTDVGDLHALATAYDSWLADWLATKESRRTDHRVLVERLGIGIGEHLVRTTDVQWAMVTDAFGTDLGVAALDDDFTVVPMNLVAVRWLNRTSGWVPGVVGHLVNLRTGMR